MYKVGSTVQVVSLKSIKDKVGIIDNIIGNLVSVKIDNQNRLLSFSEIKEYCGESATVIPLKRNVA